MQTQPPVSASQPATWVDNGDGTYTKTVITTVTQIIALADFDNEVTALQNDITNLTQSETQIQATADAQKSTVDATIAQKQQQITDLQNEKQAVIDATQQQ